MVLRQKNTAPQMHNLNPRTLTYRLTFFFYKCIIMFKRLLGFIVPFSEYCLLFVHSPTEMASFPMSEVLLEHSCFPQTTEWTECSTTCGMGISSRVTNDNPDCRLVRETRLCQIRHCELQLLLATKVCSKHTC